MVGVLQDAHPYVGFDVFKESGSPATCKSANARGTSDPPSGRKAPRV